MTEFEQSCQKMVAVLGSMGLMSFMQKVSGKCNYIRVQGMGFFVWETPDGKYWYSPTVTKAQPTSFPYKTPNVQSF